MLKFYINSLGYLVVDFTSSLPVVDLTEMDLDTITDTILSLPEMYA